MPDSPNKLSQFWQELKRRRVVHVIIVYATAAFVIIELVGNVYETLNLPDWTPALTLIILAIGFPLAIIFSWIFDVSQEGVQKTKPATEVRKDEKTVTPNSWKIASFISALVIAVLIVLNIIPRINSREILDKSIAVLPFKYLSEEADKQYLADGIMDEIILNLSKVEDLRVLARTSVEQYRVTDKTATEICQELDVAFVLEGSFLKNGDQVRLIVQLIEYGREGHAWAKKYDRSWKDIFSVQSEIAQLVASELNAVITPEEKELIDKVSTHSLTAHDFYLRGNEELWNYRANPNNRAALDRAANLYYSALDYDSTYAQAYAGLAQVYVRKQSGEIFFSKEYLDSVLILANIALTYDDQLDEAYIARGVYYRGRGNVDQAIIEFDKAIKLNPNNWEAYRNKALLYIFDDLVRWIDNVNKAAILNRGPALPSLLRQLCNAYTVAGFLEKAKYYNLEALKLDGDSVQYFLNLCDIEIILGNYDTGIEFEERAYALDTTLTHVLVELGKHYMVLGRLEESLNYIVKYVERLKELGDVNIQDMVEIGYVYWQNGYFNEAEYYFNAQIDYCNRTIELGRLLAKLKFTYYDLASVYAFKGEKEKAYENLRIFNERHRMPSWAVPLIKNDPLFDSIRDEPEFQQILRDVEAKYNAEHERVRQWLEENDML